MVEHSNAMITCTQEWQKSFISTENSSFDEFVDFLMVSIIIQVEAQTVL